jgi:predicted Zn-dependent protease
MKQLYNNRFAIFFAVILTLTLISSCKKDDNQKKDYLDIILSTVFPLEKDIDFGKQFDNQLNTNKSEYPILDETKYKTAYDYLYNIRDRILKSDDLLHAKDFTWPIKIIDNDTVLNAFCAPGGYMYFYTGIIKFLDNEAQLAGVMAHEMAHADKRHVTKTLLAQYAAQTLIGMIIGEDTTKLEEIISDLALGLGTLKFSREHEYQADEYAVKYTADTEYDPRGIAGFFEKLNSQSEKGFRTPEFLSTHPNPEHRLENIDSVYKSIGSPIGETFEDRYNELKNSLKKN